MTAAVRTVVVMAAAFGVTALGAAVVAWVLSPVATCWARRVESMAQSRLWLSVRLFPWTAGLVVAGGVGIAFGRFEPDYDGERLGVSLWCAAACGAVWVVTSCVRLVATITLSVSWMRAMRHQVSGTFQAAGCDAWVIESAFPLVAVAGLWRPRLLMARSVLTQCPPEEVAAIVAHERAHLEAGDNLWRALIAAAVDPLGWTRRGRDMARAWERAVEDAADDAAVQRAGAEVLAHALVTVARLAPAVRWPAAGVRTGFFDGDGLERRIRRLLAFRADDRRAPVRGPRVGLVWMLAAIALAALGPFGYAVYQVVEWAVQSLP